MAYWYFELDQVPDLSLSKYMSLDEAGVEGVLKKHSSFLRQLNRKGLLSRVFFHLLYMYNPELPNGKKMSVALVATGLEDALFHTKELIQNSSISPYYNIVSCESVKLVKFEEEDNRFYIRVKNHLGIDSGRYEITASTTIKGQCLEGKSIVNIEGKDKEIEKWKVFLNSNEAKKIRYSIRVNDETLLELSSELSVEENGLKIDNRRYDFLSTLGKREFFVQPSVILPDDNDLRYYRVAAWEMNEDARLFSMLKLMQGLKSPVTFRVDLYASDYAMRLREVLPVQELRNRTSMKALKSSAGITVNRDENAEETLKYYNKLIESYESSPHFRANIIAMANQRDVAELIVDAAGAEALEEGSYTIKTMTSKEAETRFSVYYGLERPIDIAQDEVINYLRFMPNLFTIDEILPFFVFPALFDGEVIEIPKETAPSFDEDGMKIAVDDNGYDVVFPIDLFKKHAFLAGVPGSGKTTSMLHLTSTLWKKFKIPFLIFEPAKQEYRALARTAGLEEMLIFSPSSGTFFPLHINPFEFPKGMSLSEHIRNLMAVFEGAFSLAPPAPFMIDYSIEAIYRDKGWYPDTINDGVTLPYPTMQELYDKLEVEVEKTDYEGEIKGNLKSILQVRIGSLLRREMGDVFNVAKSSVAPEEWLKKPALIELEAMGSGPSNFLSLLLSTLIRESLKITPNADGKELRHVIFFEEAHNLIGPVAQEITGEDADPKMAATAYVVKMLAEVRALKEGIVIADQLPTAMAPEVIKNTGLKIGHRITAEDDRELLGGTMSATGTQLEQMATFLPGEALITFEGLLRPFKAKMCQWENGMASTKSPSNQELRILLWNTKGYKSVLSRSSSIVCGKYEGELRKLKEETQRILAVNQKIKNDLKDVSKYCTDNNLSLDAVLSEEESDNPLVQKAQDTALRILKRRNALIPKISTFFEEIEELLVKEKGYFIQNEMYRKRISNILINTADLRKRFYESMSKSFDMFDYRYQRFGKEMESWNIKEKLSSAFQSETEQYS